MGTGPKICPSCNEKNNPSFTNCWKCHKLLNGSEASEIQPSETQSKEQVQTKKGIPRFLFKLMLLGFLVAIPIVAIVISLAVEARLSSRFRDVAVKAAEDAQAKSEEEKIKKAEWVEVMKKVELGRVCGSEKYVKEWELNDVCTEYKYVVIMQDAAFYSLLAGVALFIVISLLGIIGRLHRFILVILFGLGLYIALLAGIALLVVNGGLAIATLYFGMGVFLGRIPTGLMFGMGIAILFGLLGLIVPIFNTIKRAKIVVFGKMLPKEKYLEIWEFIQQASAKLGSLMPTQLIVSLGEAFFVTEADVICLDGKLRGRTMCLSLPLMRQLEKDELRTIIGHELGHFRGADTFYSQRFYPIYRGTSEGLGNLNQFSSGKESAGNVILLPAIALLVHFMDVFSRVERRIGRKRELVADDAGSELVSKEVMARALTKVCAYSGLWGAVESSMVDALNENKQITNTSSYYGLMIKSVDKDFFLKNLNTSTLEHPTDSHPPLQLRLEKLGYKINSFTNLIQTEPINQAIQLIRDFEPLEVELSTQEHRKLIRQGRAILPETKESKANEESSQD